MHCCLPTIKENLYNSIHKSHRAKCYQSNTLYTHIHTAFHMWGRKNTSGFQKQLPDMWIMNQKLKCETRIHTRLRDYHEKLCFTFRKLFVGPLLFSCSHIFSLTTVNFRVYLHFIQWKPTKINNTSFILINTDTNNATANATYSIWNHFFCPLFSHFHYNPPPSLTLLFFYQSLTPSLSLALAHFLSLSFIVYSHISQSAPPSIISDFLYAVLSTLRNPPRTRILSAKPEMIEWNNRWKIP